MTFIGSDDRGDDMTAQLTTLDQRDNLTTTAAAAAEIANDRVILNR